MGSPLNSNVPEGRSVPYLEILGSVPSIYTEVLGLSEIFERKFVENYIAVHCTLEFLYIVQ